MRVPIAPTAIRLADLPVVEIEPEPDWYSSPATPPTGPQPPEVWVANASILALRDPNAFGSVEVSGQSGRDGVGVYCHTSTGWRRASWQTLSALPNGDLLFQGATAWFDHQACRAHLWQRTRTPARSIAGGLAYAFRSSCPRCKEPLRDELHVLAPSVGWGGSTTGTAAFITKSGPPFSHSVLLLRPGDGGAVTLHLAPGAIETWRESGAKPEKRGPVVVGIDASQAAGEAEATVTVYVADDPSPP